MKDMSHQIARVAVIGAGTMGSGIAAQYANGGAAVDLLDLPDTRGRNARAEAGIAGQVRAGGFMGAGAQGRVRPGNLEDDFDRLAEADWIVEVVVEDLEVKRDLFRRIEAVRKAGSLVSSNTSTLARSDLVAGLGAAFDADFVVTHWFNPPRMMLPVEVISGPGSDAGQVARAMAAVESLLGKVVVPCRDTPGFIANRIGCTWIAIALHEAERMGLTVEQADAAMAGLGVPKTGGFGLMDLIGLDLVPLVWTSLMRALPGGDAINRHDLPGMAAIRELNAQGHHGRKSGAGFYRKAGDGSREALDLVMLAYRAAAPIDPNSVPGDGRDPVALLDDVGPLGAYAWRVFSEVVVYAALHAPEIADDARAVDDAVSLGYGWRAGPFALADRYGTERLVARLAGEGREVPPLLRAAADTGGFFAGGVALGCDGTRAAASARPAPLRVSGLKGQGAVLSNDAASVWDMGDGVHVLELHTKMNSLAPEVFDVLEGALDLAGGRVRALVLGNDEARAFSVGADLGFFLAQIDALAFENIEAYLARGARAYLAMKQAPVPVVAAVRGFALGGGCEMAMHCDVVVAHAEAKIGLPEIQVGIVPGWGGCKELVLRGQQAGLSPAEAARAAFAPIFAGLRAGSAAEAREAGLLRPGDRIVMHHDHVLATACDLAAGMAGGFAAPVPTTLLAAGAAVATALVEALPDTATETDRALAARLAWVLTGGDTAPGTAMTEADMMALERRAVQELGRFPPSQARMRHMMKTGKALAN